MKSRSISHGVSRGEPIIAKIEDLEPEKTREQVLRELYEVEGWSLRELAQHFEVSRSTIQDWFSKYGIETRSVKEAMEVHRDRTRRNEI